jgi:broad specificity phosphatase PhoE
VPLNERGREQSREMAATFAPWGFACVYASPLLLEHILKRNPAADFPGGETMDELASRVLAAIEEIGERHGGERVLIRIGISSEPT